MSHSWIRPREEVDSQLLVVGSQTGSLTPGPSFAHNLGCKCPNCQCEGIFDIYVSRPFQWHQEHSNARCFAPCCWALNIRESRKTPNLQLFQVLGFTPTLGQSGVATGKLIKGNVATEVIHDEEDLAPWNMEVKPPEPFQKNFLRHRSAGVVPVLAPKHVLVYVFEIVQVLILSNDPKQEPIATISIITDGESDLLLVLLTALELLAYKKVIGLENNHNQLYHV